MCESLARALLGRPEGRAAALAAAALVVAALVGVAAAAADMAAEMGAGRDMDDEEDEEEDLSKFSRRVPQERWLRQSCLRSLDVFLFFVSPKKETLQ